jgi:hypothetical protein
MKREFHQKDINEMTREREREKRDDDEGGEVTHEREAESEKERNFDCTKRQQQSASHIFHRHKRTSEQLRFNEPRELENREERERERGGKKCFYILA